MKYTKKYMVVPFEEESEEEVLKRKEREQDKELSDIVATNDSKSYDKYNETFKKSIYKRKTLPEDTQSLENKFQKELVEINEIIHDILENKRINNDSYFKPVSRNIRQRAEKQKKEIKKNIQKAEKTEKTEKKEKKEKKTRDKKNQLKAFIDPNKVDKFGEVLQEQIRVDQVLTEDEDEEYTTPIKSRKSTSKRLKSSTKAPKKIQNKRDSSQIYRQFDEESYNDNKSQWEHLE